MKAIRAFGITSLTLAVLVGVALGTASGAESVKTAKPASAAKAAPAPKSQEVVPADGVVHERKVHHERRGAEELIFVPGHRAVDPAAGNLLRQAYNLLASADHDYDGHRGRAMHNTSEAARLLGFHLRGEGKGTENQGSSDEQLRKAQGLLEQARSPAAGRGRVLEHLNAAIGQISTALRVR